MENVSVLMFSGFFRWFLIGIALIVLANIADYKFWDILFVICIVLGILITVSTVFLFILSIFDQTCIVQFSGQFILCIYAFLQVASLFIIVMLIIDIIVLISAYINFSKINKRSIKITFRQFKDFINVDTENTWNYNTESVYKSIREKYENFYHLICEREKEKIYVTFSFIDYIKYRIFLYVQEKEACKSVIVKENNEYNERAIRLLKSVQSDIEVFAKKEVTL